MNEMTRRQAEYTLAEFSRLQACLQRWAVAGSPYQVEDIASLWWGTYTFLPLDEGNQVQIWETADGEVAAFALLESDFLTPSIAPDYRRSEALLGQILRWAEAEVKAAGLTELLTWGYERESATRDFLEAQGFGLQDEPSYLVKFQRDLAEPIPELAPLEGITVRHVGGEHEFTERIEAHRDAFAPSRFSREVYDRVRSSPVYRPELDLVAVAEDGTIVGYCICWFDPLTQFGVFEPVGTRAAYQGRGIGKRVMTEGLRRLQALGAEVATLHTGSGNAQGIGLYEALGFRQADRAVMYRKVLG